MALAPINDNQDLRAPKAFDDREGVFQGGVFRAYLSKTEANTKTANRRYPNMVVPITIDVNGTATDVLHKWNGTDWVVNDAALNIPLAQKNAVGGVPLISDVAINTTVSGIRGLSGTLKSNLYHTNDIGKEGDWIYDPTDTTSVDNTGTVLVSSDGKRFKRQHLGEIFSTWFEIEENSTTEQTVKIQKAIDATPTGGKFNLKESTYVCGRLTRFENKFIEGNNSLILQTGNRVVFEGKGAWTIKERSISSIELATVYITGTPYLVSKLNCDTTGFAAKDLVKIYSNDLIPDSSIGQRYIGEFATVVEVYPTYILLNSTLYDNYVTDVRIAKMAKDTVSISNLRFNRNNEPLVVPGDSGSGQGAYIRLSALYNPKLFNIEVANSISNALVIHSCYAAVVDRPYGENLPNQPLIQRWGYLVCDANSEFLTVNNIMATNVRHAYTTNTYDIDSDPTNPANYGRSRYANVNNGRGFGGHTAHFDTHDGARGITFNNCFGANSDWGEDINSEPGVPSSSFVVRATGTRIVDCGAESDTGIFVLTATGQNGGDNDSTKVKDVEIVNFNGTLSRTALRVQNANVKLSKSILARKSGVNYGDSAEALAKLFIVLDRSNLEISQTDIKDLGDNDHNLFTIGNSSVTIDGGTIDLSQVILNGSNQQTNFDYRLFYVYEALVKQNIIFKNARIILKDRIIDTVGRCATVAAANSFITVDNIETQVTSTLKTLSNGSQLTRRITGGSFSNVKIIQDFASDKINISNFRYLDVQTGAITNNEYINQTTSIIQNLGRTDKFLYANINPPTNAFNITSIDVGRLSGQLLVIRNSSGSNTIVVPSSLANTNLSSNITITPKTELGLRWNGTAWEAATPLLNLPATLMYTDAVQINTAEKSFRNGTIIMDDVSTGNNDRKWRSGGVDMFYERLLATSRNLQLIARDNVGALISNIVTYIRLTANTVFGNDVTDYPSSLVTMNSTTKGFTPPRLTSAQRKAVSSPNQGLRAFDFLLNWDSIYDGVRWTTSAIIRDYTTDITDFASIQAKYPLSDYPVGVTVLSVNTSMLYHRISDTQWYFMPFNILT